MSERDERLKQSILKLIDEHVPLPARPRSGDIGWLAVLQNQHERVMRLGGENSYPAERESLLLDRIPTIRRGSPSSGESLDQGIPRGIQVGIERGIGR
jgi:hypothetical protein